MHRALGAARVLVVTAPLALGACDLQDRLLEPQQPGVISPDVLKTAGATGAQALYVGAIDAFKNWSGAGGNNNSQSITLYADLLTDVWKVSDTFSQRIDMDRREVQTFDAEITGRYAVIQQSRGHFRNAMGPLREFLSAEPWKEGEMYFALGLAEMYMAEVFCNGIPLGETVGGQVTYSAPLTNDSVYKLAIVHQDSAILLAAGTGTAATQVRNAALIAKARTQMNLGQFAAARTTVAGIPTTYQYLFTFAQTSGDNTLWTTNRSNPTTSRVVVGDSVTMSQGVEVRILNALPFGSANDPRVPVTGSYSDFTRTGFDGSTPWVGQNIWNDRNDPLVVVSGIDARLIEAEAELRENDIVGMMAILNALRASPQTLGNHPVAAMAPLAIPLTQAAATDLFFREKAFWQFGRGTRLGDLRRLMRQYGRAENAVFPEGTGAFHKAPFNFGNDVNFAVPDSEETNPAFTGCLDRSA